MYHTDFSSNLRKARHKNPKILSPSKSDDNACDSELLRTILAVVLVILALLQMDPANAQSTEPTAGYGTTTLCKVAQPI